MAGLDASEPYRTPVENSPYPEDILAEIIHKFAELEVTRSDWLPLRLVNRFFNYHILFAVYVLDPRCVKYARASACDFEYYGTETEWLSPKFAPIERSWWLQGQLIREGELTGVLMYSDRHIQESNLWKELVDKSAHLITAYFEETSNNMIKLPLLTGFAGSLTSPVSATFQIGKELICNAVASLLTIETLPDHFRFLAPMSFFEKAGWYRPSPPARRFDWSACDIFLLTMCFTGDLDAVQHCLALTSQIYRSPDDFERLRFAGLYVALRQNHETLVSSLLASGFVSSNEKWSYILCAAAQTGNISMLRSFLGPHQLARKDLAQLRYVLIQAAEYPDTAMRIDMCKFLLSVCGEVSMQLRTEMLVTACRSNDVTFAEWIMRTGPVERCGSGIGPPTFNRLDRHPFFVAVNHGSEQALRLLLKVKDELFDSNERLIVQMAFRNVRSCGVFNTLMELLPYRSYLSHQQLLEHAARIEHAVEMVDKTLKLAKTLAPGNPQTAKVFDPTNMIQTAVDYLCLANLEWILAQGFRTKTMVIFQPNDKRRRSGQKCNFDRAASVDLKRIEDLLRAYNNPGIEFRCCYCKSTKNLSEILELARPWEYKCTCIAMG